jgi:pimeloyl-ACP methyl ester carboxylesterase
MTASIDQYSRSGLTFPVRDSGPADAEPVVLLHGFPQTAASYDRVVGELNRRQLRTLVPTQRGYAATARPPRRRDYCTTELARDVVQLITAARVERVHLVGHDWGGVVAWAVAGWRPDLVRSLTVLSTPHPAAMRESLLRSSQARKSWYMALFQLPALPERMLSRDLARQLVRGGLPPDQAADYAAAMAEPAALTGALNWYRGLPFSLRPEVPDVAVPTTYVWGRTDFALGSVAARRTGAHVVDDYRFLDMDAGHWLPETHPAEVAQAIIDRIDRTH